jgi:class 3 adenylate cyclase
VEILDRDIAGIAVHLAKRVEAAARPGTVWVSQTVHDLVVGSGITFVDRGVHELKGFVEGRRLYEVIGT